jgi:hypothetical protein
MLLQAVFFQVIAAKVLDLWPPVQLRLNESSQGNNYQIVLNEKPAGDVRVFSSGSNLRFKDEFKTFTTNNWDVPQVVFVRASPMWSNASREVIKVINRIFITGNTFVDELFSISRDVVPGKICTSSGDPHIKMFSGINLADYHSPMTQTLFTNKDFDVQQIQRVCSFSKTANCGVAVAIRYGSSVFIIDTREGDTNFKEASPNIDGVDYHKSLVTNKKAVFVSLVHYFKFPEGSNIEVTVFPRTVGNRTSYHLSVGIWQKMQCCSL